MEKKKCLLLLCSEPSGKYVSPMVEMRKERRDTSGIWGVIAMFLAATHLQAPHRLTVVGITSHRLACQVPSSCSSQIHSHRTYSRISYFHRFTLEMSFKIYFVEIRNLNEIVKEINKSIKFCFSTGMLGFLKNYLLSLLRVEVIHHFLLPSCGALSPNVTVELRTP